MIFSHIVDDIEGKDLMKQKHISFVILTFLTQASLLIILAAHLQNQGVKCALIIDDVECTLHQLLFSLL